MNTAIDKFLNLRRDQDRNTGMEKPYKPLVLLVAVDLIEENICSPHKIVWSQKISDRFTDYYEIVKKTGNLNNVQDPFPRLHTDGIWKVIDKKTGYHYKKSLPKKLYGKVEAIPEPDVKELLLNPASRQELRNIIISRYFAEFHDELNAKNTDYTATIKPELEIVEAIRVKRRASFRNEIARVYDNQCAACGIRVTIPLGKKIITYINAAHLIPFSISFNDHPNNGISLCKNHLWALDQHLIAPSPDGTWHVSSLLDPKRSNGEKELQNLAKQSILLPKEQSYHPSTASLEWRIKRLLS